MPTCLTIVALRPPANSESLSVKERVLGMAAAGLHHSAAVGEDGSLFVWGTNYHGQLGTGDTDRRLVPTRVAGLPAPVRQVAAGS